MKIVYIILLLLWFVFGCMWCNKRFCGEATAAATKAAPAIGATGDGACKSALAFRDKNKQIDLVSNENFKFNNSSYSRLTVSDDLDGFIDKAALFFDGNDNMRMQIKGWYTTSETNNSDFDNLGLARANDIKTYFLTKGIRSDQMSTKGSLLESNCFDEDVLQKGVSIAVGPK